MEGYDSIPLAPSASSDVYIGDQGSSSTGPPKVVIDSIARGAKALDSVVQEVFGCSFAIEKNGHCVQL
eukprot:9470067-Pyramimonas_sp.AAC.1